MEVGRGRCRLWGTVLVAGDGVAVTVVGGEGPHIGAVALAVPRPSLRSGGRRSATTSVLAVTGHKDDEIARPLAAGLAGRLGRIAVVAAGVHLERPRARDLARVLANADRLLEAVAERIRRDEQVSHGRRKP